jgi:hypothetical protein
MGGFQNTRFKLINASGLCYFDFGGYIPQERSMAKAATERAVMVTTQHRGVFFGYATDTTGEAISLKRARMAVYWVADLRGVLGLAAPAHCTPR